MWGCKSPQELTVSECALTAANELRRPHRLNRKCWKPGTPPGTLPTRTCSCSPTPAAFFALCKPLLCLQSVGWDQKTMTTHHFFTVNQHYQIHTYWQTQSNSTGCKASDFPINPVTRRFMSSSLKDFVSSSVSHWSPASSIFFRVKIFTSILPKKKKKTHNTHTL